MNTTNRNGTRERGAVAIIVALSLPVLIGFAGLALDLGRLFVTKTELQNAADACALAAANELVCDPSITSCPREFLLNAESAGIFVAGRNKKDFQDSSVTIAPSDIKFYTALAPNDNYKPSGTADTKSTFAMCTPSATGLIPYLMGALGFGPQAVSAQAVATRAPAQSSCNSAPVGICAKPSAAGPNYGFGIGEKIIGQFTSNSRNPNDDNDATLSGGFRWVDYTANAGGTNEVRNQLLGNDEVCGIRIGNNVTEQGVKQGAKSAWNTRFGFYPIGSNAETMTSAPPDKTGYSYPSKAISFTGSAYDHYVGKQAVNAPFNSNEYDPQTPAGANIPGTPITQADHLKFGAERRLVASPIIDCSQTTTTPILGMACVLMLNPMSSGANGEIYLEWRGLANAAGSACRSAGVVGGVSGPRIPTLVQ